MQVYEGTGFPFVDPHQKQPFDPITEIGGRIHLLANSIFEDDWHITIMKLSDDWSCVDALPENEDTTVFIGKTLYILDSFIEFYPRGSAMEQASLIASLVRHLERDIFDPPPF